MSDPKTPATERQNNDLIDATKFVLSIFVVAIHTRPLSEYTVFLRPILRTAVPMFFLISSYFFFKQHKALSNTEDRFAHLEKYISRNMHLYFFWMLIFLAPSISYRQWFSNGLLNGLVLWMQSFLTGSTFIASWFIMAAVIATASISLLSRYLSNGQLLCLSLIPFTVCCLMSNYGNAPFVLAHMNALTLAFGISFNSFWVALFWVVTGKIIAESSFNDRLDKKILPLAVFGAVILYCEQAIVVNFNLAIADDCFFSLPLLCIPVFFLLLNCNIHLRHARFFRCASTITFCLHANLQYILRSYCGLEISQNAMFLIALATSWMLTILILKFEKIPHFGWLRYSH